MNLNKAMRKSMKIILTAISPKLETTVNYRYSTGRWLDWQNPQDINAKINWLKINRYYKNDLITQCADKYRVREFLASKNLISLCPKLYGVYDSVDEIEWDIFPNQFVLKCNHACDTNLIVKDKKKLDVESAKQKIKEWLKINYWREGEVQYRYIKKKIIVEEYLGGGEDLKTYKFFCFNGEPKVLYISMEEDKYIDYYDMAFQKLPYSLPGHEHYDGRGKGVKCPRILKEMVDIARVLSKDFPFVRVDLYDSKGKIYFSELTFIPTGGYMKIDPPEVLDEWGEWLNIHDI